MPIRFVIFDPEPDGRRIYVIGAERAFALYQGRLSIPAWANATVRMGEVWLSEEGEHRVIRHCRGGKLHLDHQGINDQEIASQMRDALVDKAMEPLEGAHFDSSTLARSSERRFRDRRISAGKWEISPAKEPQTFARLVNYFCLGKRSDKLIRRGLPVPCIPVSSKLDE